MKLFILAFAGPLVAFAATHKYCPVDKYAKRANWEGKDGAFSKKEFAVFYKLGQRVQDSGQGFKKLGQTVYSVSKTGHLCDWTMLRLGCTGKAEGGHAPCKAPDTRAYVWSSCPCDELKSLDGQGVDYQYVPEDGPYKPFAEDADETQECEELLKDCNSERVYNKMMEEQQDGNIWWERGSPGAKRAQAKVMRAEVLFMKLPKKLQQFGVWPHSLWSKLRGKAPADHTHEGYEISMNPYNEGYVNPVCASGQVGLALYFVGHFRDFLREVFFHKENRSFTGVDRRTPLWQCHRQVEWIVAAAVWLNKNKIRDMSEIWALPGIPDKFIKELHLPDFHLQAKAKAYLNKKIPSLKSSKGATWNCQGCSFAGPVMNQMSGHDLKAAQQQAKPCEGSSNGNDGVASAVCCQSKEGNGVCCAAAATGKKESDTSTGCDAGMSLMEDSEDWEVLDHSTAFGLGGIGITMSLSAIGIILGIVTLLFIPRLHRIRQPLQNEAFDLNESGFVDEALKAEMAESLETAPLVE